MTRDFRACGSFDFLGCGNAKRSEASMHIERQATILCRIASLFVEIPWKPLLTGLLLCQWRIGLDGYKGMVVPRKRVRLWVQGIPVAGHAHLEVLV